MNPVIVTRTWTFLGAALALTASMLVWACESSGGGGDCFPPEHGPDGPSCVGFDVGLSCPVSLGPYYTCTCTKSSADTGADAGPPQVWDCTMSGAGGGGVGGGGVGGGGAGGGKAGTGGSGTGGGK